MSAPLPYSPPAKAERIPYGTLTEIAGIQVGVAAAGIRPSGGLDLLVLSHPGAAVAGVTTRSTAVAAPCKWTRSLLPGFADALVVNAGNANAATGTQGEADAKATAERAAAALGTTPERVLLASTGVIGRMMPMDKVFAGVDAACAALRPHAGHAAACAILTTDSGPKEVAFQAGGVKVAGIAKGAGMIHPNMATMLSFIATDAKVAPEHLQAILKPAVDRSFNALSVDGDSSTNDTVVLIATGKGAELAPGAPGWAELVLALESTCTHLAQAIAADGEGATTLIEAVVEGPSESEGRALARAVVKSNLVKAAVHGRDPNWGRIVGALGQAQAHGLDALNLDIGGVPVVREGQPLPLESEKVAQAMQQPQLRLHIQLPADPSAPGLARAWGCDLSAEYVRINADYTS